MADFSALKATIQSYIKQNGNEAITGNILQDILLAMVTTMGDSAINGLSEALGLETTNRQNADGILRNDINTLSGTVEGMQTAINGINTKLAEGYIYAGIATPSTNPGTPSGKVFYIATSAGTYTNFGNATLSQGINILKYSGSWSSEQAYGVADGMSDASGKLVKGSVISEFQKNILMDGTFQIETLMLDRGFYYIDGSSILYNSSENWRNVMVPVKNLKKVVTYAVSSSFSLKVAAVIYFTGAEPTTANYISGSEQYGTVPTSDDAIFKFVSDLVIPSTAKYALVNISNVFLDDNCILAFGGAVSDRIEYLEMLYKGVNKISVLPMDEGAIYIENAAIQKLESSNWKSLVVPVSGLAAVVTYAGTNIVSLPYDIPAIIYLTGKDAITDNFISGAEQYGEIETSNENINKFNSVPVIPNTAKYAAINVYVPFLDDGCIVSYNDEWNAKRWLMAIGKNAFSEMVLFEGCYKLESSQVVYTGSSSWRNAILPIDGLKSIVTFAGSVLAPVDIPALIYLTGKNPSTDYISGSEQYGNVPTDNPAITKFESELVIPNNAAYVLVNINNSYMDGSCVADYIESTAKRCVVRKTPSTGEYSTIAAALAAASVGGEVVIYEGVYEEYHLNVLRGQRLIGIGDVEIRGELPDNVDVSTLVNYSTLECSNGATLKNLKVTAKNMRYPIHADFSDGNSRWIVENCVFEHKGNVGAYEYQLSLGGSGNPDGIFSACSAWGGGTRGGDEVRCTNCKFVSVARAFSTHNNEDASFTSFGASHVYLQDCEMISKGIDRDGDVIDLTAPLFVQSLDCPVDGCDVVVDNCKINGYVVLQNSGGDGWSNKLKLFNCGDLKLCFSSYGSGSTSIASGDQTSVYEGNYQKYPVMDSIVKFVNRGSAAIGINKAVKKSLNGGVAPYASDSDEFFGVAMNDIPVGGIGDVCVKGFLSRIYLSGLRTTAITEGDVIYINSDGTFSLTGTKQVFMVSDHQNVEF